MAAAGIASTPLTTGELPKTLNFIWLGTAPPASKIYSEYIARQRAQPRPSNLLMD